jgi:dihydroxyacetone kinase-like predicted kinase
MNPSTDELLAGIHAVSAERVIVLPNSPNVVMAARTAAALSARDAVVVECTSQQAGLVAMVEVDPAAELAANEERLNQALAEIRVAGVAPAAKDDAAGRFVRGDAVGLRGDEVIAWGGAGSTLRATIEALAEGAEIVTIIEGEGAPIALGEVTTMAPDGLDVEAHAGGQPHYWWLLAVQ